MAEQSITVQELSKLNAAETVELIDVRTPAEFAQVHATIARNVPLESLAPETVMKSRNGTAESLLYVICQSGGRSGMACRKFNEAGFANVVNVEGGTNAWASAGFEVVRGKKTMSLERQVRILAGFIVLVGAVLALTVNKLFAGIPAFIGAGLMFAGITDTCGMGMMLAKMPWNQCSTPPNDK